MPSLSPDFLFVAPDMAACAAFIKESRMKFINANKLHRKPRGIAGYAVPFTIIFLPGNET
jgi:hypothetical protein